MENLPEVVVRAFQAQEWAIYLRLRLAALMDSPDAFGSTLAREAGRTEAEWAERLAAGVVSGRDRPLVAEVDGQAAGLAWVRIDETDTTVAHLYQVWVAPGCRRRGAGRKLLEAAIAWAAAQGACELELGATCGDTPARRLYARAGFEVHGEPEPLRPGAPELSQRLRLRVDGV